LQILGSHHIQVLGNPGRCGETMLEAFALVIRNSDNSYVLAALGDVVVNFNVRIAKKSELAILDGWETMMMVHGSNFLHLKSFSVRRH
jgi:hypothetical protein